MPNLPISKLRSHINMSKCLTGREQAEIQQAIEALQGVTLLRQVLDSAVSRAVLTLLEALAAPEAEAAVVARAYSNAWYALAAAANEDPLLNVLPDAWQSFLVNRTLDDVNPWSRQAEQADMHGVAATLIQQAQ